MDLSNNPYEVGDIPSSFFGLTNLEYLYMTNCNLDCPISTDIANMVNIRILSLGYNKLYGTLPHSLGKMTHLELLYLANNQLSGHIHAEIFSDDLVQHFQAIDVSNNRFTGEIPASLFLLPVLTSVALGVNCFDGIAQSIK